MRSRRSSRAHSLLELIVATGIFVMVSVALSGVWVMYGRSLAKSAEVMAANSIARSATEGLTANGWDWLKSKQTATPADLGYNVKVERIVRGRQADINYRVSYSLQFNEAGRTPPLFAGAENFTTDLCQIVVYVRWRATSGRGQSADPDFNDPNFNNEATYSAYFYRHGI